ncbi:MAG: PEP-CTERM sorting domain-containing protein [Pirellulales bacterium]|nr:PEP-CTERM sorting domain-containing protein [Pirellulales bacterium]
MFTHLRDPHACAARRCCGWLFFSLLLLTGLTDDSRGDDRLWKNAVSGSFGDVNRWTLGLVAGNTDRAVFAVDGTYNVNFLIGRVNNQLLVGKNDVTFNLATNTYSLTGATEGVVVGGTSNGALLNISNGTLRAFDLIVGRDANLGGTVNVLNTAVLEMLDDATVGDQSVGQVAVASGEFSVVDNLVIGNQSGAAGSSVTVEGSDSTLNVGGTTTVGKAGAASLSVSNFAEAITHGVVFGQNDGVSGQGTADAVPTWTNTGNFVVGESGDGTVEIKNATALSTDKLFIAALAGSTGEMTVTGTDTSVTVANDLVVGGSGVGPGGMGHLIINSGAEVSRTSVGAAGTFADGKITLNGGSFASGGTVVNFGTIEGIGTIQSENGFANDGLLSPGLSPGTLHVVGNYAQTTDGTLKIEIGGYNPGVNFDLLSILRGSVELGGALQVSLFGGFVPVLGDEFAFLLSSEPNSVSGEFDTKSFPALPDGLAWDVIYNPEDVRLKIVPIPEPSSLVLGALGAIGLAVLFRRRYK